jgi:lipid-A-disaccharide synthase
MITSNKLKVYLIAGEPSGDLLGSRLIRALKEKTNNNVEFMGLGGDTMEKEGIKPLFDISELAVMGLVEVIPSIPRVLKRIKQTVNDIIKKRPDIVITIDSWSFCSRIHKALRKLNTGIPQLHYVAPQVWAWKKRRARTMYKYVDKLLTKKYKTVQTTKVIAKVIAITLNLLVLPSYLLKTSISFGVLGLLFGI